MASHFRLLFFQPFGLCLWLENPDRMCGWGWCLLLRKPRSSNNQHWGWLLLHKLDDDPGWQGKDIKIRGSLFFSLILLIYLHCFRSKFSLLGVRSRLCQRICLIPGFRSGEEKPGPVLAFLATIHGMPLDRPQSGEMDVASMVEIPTGVTSQVQQIVLNFLNKIKCIGDTVEVLGTCCGKPGTGDCGGYSGGKSALEHYKDGLFEDPKVTTWKSEYIIAISVGPTHLYAGGSNEEVYWIGNGYHRGGYAYRLCRVHEGQFWRVTEECFQRGHLNFAG